MSARFDVKMTKKILYDFLMTHTYRSFGGWFSIVIGVLGIVMTITSIGKASMTMTVVYAAFSLYFLLYQPITLYLKAAKQLKLNAMYREPMHYEVNDEGITTSQNEQVAQIPWEKVLKVTESKYSYFLYTGRIYSFVLPKESMGVQAAVVESLIKKHLAPGQVKIK